MAVWLCRFCGGYLRGIHPRRLVSPPLEVFLAAYLHHTAGVGGEANTGRFDSRTHNGTIEVMSVAITNETGTKMIDCREAARRYGCTMRYIRRLAADGRLSYEVVGGSYLFSAAEIEQIKRDAAAATGRERKRAEGFQPG